MKATLEFNLPDDQEQFELVTKAQDYQTICKMMWQVLLRARDEDVDLDLEIDHIGSEVEFRGLELI